MAKQGKVAQAAKEVAVMVKAGMPSPILSSVNDLTGNKKRGQKAKNVGRDWGGAGYADAAGIWAAMQESGKTQAEILTHLAVFAPFGFKAASGNGKAKKREFSEQAESYFNGWKEYRKTLGEREQRSFGVRYSEAKRACYAYILAYEESQEKGVAELTEKFLGEGTYQSKIADLPLMTAKREKKADKKNDKTTGEQLAGLKAAEQKQVQEAVSTFTEKEIGALAASASESQTEMLISALTIRAKASKDKVLSEWGAQAAELFANLKKKYAEQEPALDANAAEAAKGSKGKKK